MKQKEPDMPAESPGPIKASLTRPGMSISSSPIGASRKRPSPFQASVQPRPDMAGDGDDMEEPSRHEFSSMQVPISPEQGVMSQLKPGYTTQARTPAGQSAQSSARQAPDVQAESKIERERKLSTFLDNEFSHVNYYSPVDPKVSVYEKNDGQKFMGRFLFHNKNINMLSYNCVGENDRRPYEVTFLSFQEASNRDRMAVFLDTLKLAAIPDLRKMHSYFTDNKMNKSRIILIDAFQNSINLSSLVSFTKEFPEIATLIRQNEFIYKVITVLWETVRQFRNKGLKDLGISSNLITLLDKKESHAIIRDPVVKIRRFFKDPTAVIDYKCSHFLRLILSDEKKKNAITISDLATINFIPKFMVEIIAKYRVDYTDELAFALVIIEILIGESCENIAKEIDFETGKISPELEGNLDHPFFVSVIKRCLKIPRQREVSDLQDEFFSESNSDFMTLTRLLNSDISNSQICLQQMHPKILKSGLVLIDKGKLIKILANSDYDQCSPDQTSVIIEFLMENNFLHYAFVYIKSCFTRFDEYNSLYNSFPFVFHMIEKIIQDDKIPMSQKVIKLHTEDLKQLLAIAPTFLFHPKYDSM